MSYFKDQQFEAWLQSNGDNQASQSRGYIDSIVSKVFTPYSLEGIFTNLPIAIKQKANTIEKLQQLHAIINKAATLKTNHPNTNVLAKTTAAPSSIVQYCSVLKKYIQFLEVSEPNTNTYKKWGAQQWGKNLTDFWKETVKAVAIDGYTSLLNAQAIGSIENLVKLAIENSYFINATVANDYHKDLLDAISNNKDIPARSSEDKNKQAKTAGGQLVFKVSDTKTIPITEDPDGNKSVRDLIEEKTGFTVSSGYDNFFTNYKISHIWGCAYDPRCFTSLWNIVLVPAWANDLLDKTNSASEIVNKMINTYKAVCEKLYGVPAKLKVLGLTNECSQSNANQVVHGDYDIHTLGNKGNKQPIGSISVNTVHI